MCALSWPLADDQGSAAFEGAADADGWPDISLQPMRCACLACIGEQTLRWGLVGVWDYTEWLDGTPKEAMTMARPYPAHAMKIVQTGEGKSHR